MEPWQVMPWYGMVFGPLMMVLVLVTVVVVAVLLVRWIDGGLSRGPEATHQPIGKMPLDILKERFARGEIDKEEFEERRRVLGD